MVSLPTPRQSKLPETNILASLCILTPGSPGESDWQVWEEKTDFDSRPLFPSPLLEAGCLQEADNPLCSSLLLPGAGSDPATGAWPRLAWFWSAVLGAQHCPPIKTTFHKAGLISISSEGLTLICLVLFAVFSCISQLGRKLLLSV